MRRRGIAHIMERKKSSCDSKAHVLAIPYPTQGHINPMLQFSKRLVSKRIKVTLAITKFISNSINLPTESDKLPVEIDTISDGFDEGGFLQAKNVEDYLETLEIQGKKTLVELIKKHQETTNPIDCILYDSFLPWCFDVAKQFGLISASFFTQPCAVNYVYYYIYKGFIKLPISSYPLSLNNIQGLPLLHRLDMPSFVAFEGSFPAYFELVLNQFLNAEKADFLLVNSFYKLEEQVVDSMSKVCPILPIGPTLPSFYLDKRVENDKDYGLNLFGSSPNDASIISTRTTITNWLNNKPKSSVIYVSFGSLACLQEKQIQEIALALKETKYYFIWVVRTLEEESKLPKDFVQEIIKSQKGLLVRWSCQIEVLSNDSIGCFLSHCGWNSSIEALSFGVPIIGMPQWSDQLMNAKLIEDVWKVGIRLKLVVDDDGELGFVCREEIEDCIKQVMEGEKGKEMKRNALKWKDLAKEAISEGGTSDRSIDEFISIFK